MTHAFAPDELHDAVIVGSGFGGAMVAHELIEAGRSVLMVERGDWVPRGPQAWAPDAVMELTAHYCTETPYRVIAGGEREVIGSYACVGGPSVFYGAVAMRFRERDFEPDPRIVGDSGARWPFGYGDLEPYYLRAERIIGVAGATGEDPTEPPRSAPYPQPPAPLSAPSRRIGDAARRLGLHPFRLPLAINYRETPSRPACIRCATCDCYACGISAKNDLATAVLPDLIARGLELRPNTVAVRLLVDGARVTGVECRDRSTGTRIVVRARQIVIAAGALGSPHLLLASGVDRLNSAGQVIGRYLMRHCNAMVFGIFPRRPNAAAEFHKQLGIHDFYFSEGSPAVPDGPVGGIQQIHGPAAGLVRSRLPRVLGAPAALVARHMTGLLVIAEDQPRAENGVTVDPTTRDRFGLPQLVITHRYTARDLAARRALVRQARRILRRAGAPLQYIHEVKTFSHAVGTVRMGDDPATSALDDRGRFRGVENLWVADGSTFPTSAAVNPSLTIAAVALRSAEAVVECLAATRAARPRGASAGR